MRDSAEGQITLKWNCNLLLNQKNTDRFHFLNNIPLTH